MKGSQFEREICRKLSKWWTDGKREDVFWRTSSSGAMATIRKKTNKSTFGQYGDVQAVDPIGSELLKNLTIEIKRGYSNNSFSDLLEKPKSIYWDFIEQAEKESYAAGKSFWWLIVKRDRKEIMCIMLFSMARKLLISENKFRDSHIKFSIIRGLSPKKELYTLFAMKLDDLLSIINRKTFETINNAEEKVKKII